MVNSPENRPQQSETIENQPIRDSVSKADMIMVRQEGIMSVTKSSSGPGGQNVNKTAKTAEFRWTPADSEVFNVRERQMIINWMQENKPSQLVGDGEIYITNTEQKTLVANKKAVMKILHRYLQEALTPPKERKATKPTRGSVERRIQEKKITAEKKAQRGRISHE